MLIDSDNYKASGVEVMFFPGGEPHAKIPRIDFLEPVVFVLRARTWNDVGLGACVWDALRRQWESHNFHSWDTYPKLFMPYSPAARQDKSDGRAPITKAIVASMFATNRNIHVFDIHSDLAAWNWRPKNWMPSDLQIEVKDDVVGIIVPDAGAHPRALDFQRTFYPMVPIYQCTKTRDQSTGKLSNYVLPKLGRYGRHIVVDDICDGGGTFHMLAEAYKQEDKGPLELFVSHGIFSKGFEKLREYYDHFTTTDSFFVPRDKTGFPQDPSYFRDLTIIPLTPIVEKLLK